MQRVLLEYSPLVMSIGLKYYTGMEEYISILLQLALITTTGYLILAVCQANSYSTALGRHLKCL